MAYATETIGLRGTDTYTGIVDCNLNEDTPGYHWPDEERYLQPESGSRRFVGYTLTFPNHGACTVLNAGWQLFRVFGGSVSIGVYPVTKAMNAATATWEDYDTYPQPWDTAGALGAGDIGSQIFAQTITADVAYVFVGAVALNSLVAAALNGGSTLRFLIKRTDADLSTPRFITAPYHSNTSVATYFTYDWQASGGGGSSIAAISNHHRRVRRT